MDVRLLLDLFLIFALRTLDVGISTVRIVLLGRGRRGTAALLGFVEALIWVLVIAAVLDGVNDGARIVAFAAGFAMGTYLGSRVEEWLAIGQVLVRVVAPIDTPEVAPALRELGFGATVINADGMNGEVRLTFCVVDRRRVKDVTGAVHAVNPNAYVTVDDTTSIDLARHEPRVRT